jgi:hypothetical protein
MKTPVIDLRSLQANPPKVQKKHRLERGKVALRHPGEILGIGLHQTAVHFGVAKYQVQAAKDVFENHSNLWPAARLDEVAKDLRALDIAAHVTVFLEPPGPPRIVLANPFLWWVHHGNALNPFTIGLEIEAKHAMFVPTPKKGKNPFHPLTEAQVQAIQDAIRVIKEEAAKEDIEIRHIWGHCQSNGKKPSDPGEAIWRAAAGLGLVPEYERTWKTTSRLGKDGVKIPKRWV